MTELTPPTVPVVEGEIEADVTEEPGAEAPPSAQAVQNIDSENAVSGVPLGDTPLSDPDEQFRTVQTARLAEFGGALRLAKITARDLVAETIRARALATDAEVTVAVAAEELQARRIANLEQAITDTQSLLDTLPAPSPIDFEDADDPETIARRQRIAAREAEAEEEAARLEPDPTRDLAEHNARLLVGVQRTLNQANVQLAQLTRDVNVIRSQTDRALTARSDQVNDLHARVRELEAAAGARQASAARIARAREATVARTTAAREAEAARSALAVAAAAELSEMTALRTMEESDHALAERTARDP
ncbi:g595 [Coccomyxa elongata]